MGVAVLVGTRKGLFVIRGDEGRRGWSIDGPHLTGWEVFHAVLDPRDESIHAATNSFVYGATVHRSGDRGQTWERSEGIGLPEDSGLTLEKTWHVEPGRADEPGRLWLGAAPGALFRTDDGGTTWEPVRSLLDDPTRERWQPGAGGMCTHSIQLDPSDPQRMYVGISAVGQCVHKLLAHPARPERLWQQNHCGVYRSDDRGESWERLEGNGLPSGFGFPLALDPADPDVAFVVPENGAEGRVTCNGRLGVYRTSDGGASWKLLTNGLPKPAWEAVKREGMSFDRLDPVGIYLGTQSGSVFVSPDGGGEWLEVARHLPEILSVEAAEWP